MKGNALDLKGADNICSDPRDPNFFAGTTLERKLSALKFVCPEKYDAVGVIVLDVLRDEFLKIGPDPKEARKGVY